MRDLTDAAVPLVFYCFAMRNGRALQQFLLLAVEFLLGDGSLVKKPLVLDEDVGGGGGLRSCSAGEHEGDDQPDHAKEKPHESKPRGTVALFLGLVSRDDRTDDGDGEGNDEGNE